MTRRIEVGKPIVRPVEVPAQAEPRSAEDWAAMLELLATRLAQGRIYRRDLPTLQPAVKRLAEVWLRTVNPH